MPIVGAFIVPHPPIILPEIGRGEEKKIQKTITAYREAARRAALLKPETVIVTSPHATMYADYFHISPGERARGDFRQFGAAEVSVQAEYDTQLVQAITDTAGEAGIPAGTFGEQSKNLDHGTMIPLRFLDEFNENYKVVRIGLSGLSVLDHYRFGKCVAKACDTLGRRAVFIASGDLSHKLTEDGPYGFAAEGPEFDSKITDYMAKGNFLKFMEFSPEFCNAAAECGLRSFIIMSGALDGMSVEPELLSYEGPFGVGYGVCAFSIQNRDENRRFDLSFEAEQQNKLNEIKVKEDPYVKLARLSLETYVKIGKMVSLPENLPSEMFDRKAGVFVSLKKYGELRGCIGTISPVTNSVAEEILRNAVSAGTDDPRFSGVTPEELPNLVYSVDVLSEPEPIDSIAQLDVKHYGVIVSDGRRQGLLLPDLAGVDTPEKQVSIAMRKAGIKKIGTCSLERFEVVRHK